jgi:hypothetical protein
MSQSAVVHEFQKNHREVVRTSLQQFEGRSVADFRVWLPRSRDGVLVPCAKGLTIDHSQLVDLELAVKAALAADARSVGAAHGQPGQVGYLTLHAE